jgi:hypothetical protein
MIHQQTQDMTLVDEACAYVFQIENVTRAAIDAIDKTQGDKTQGVRERLFEATVTLLDAMQSDREYLEILTQNLKSPSLLPKVFCQFLPVLISAVERLADRLNIETDYKDVKTILFSGYLLYWFQAWLADESVGQDHTLALIDQQLRQFFGDAEML